MQAIHFQVVVPTRQTTCSHVNPRRGGQHTEWGQALADALTASMEFDLTRGQSAAAWTPLRLCAGHFVCRQVWMAAGPHISTLALPLQQDWDYAADAHLGSIHSCRKAWWRSGMCKTGQPHRWQATISHRSDGSKCPYDSGKAVHPCDDLAHNHPEVAAEWDWETNGERTPETVAASSNIKAAWRCGLCGHRWSAAVFSRTKVRATECPQCARAASRIQTRQPSISNGAPHLLAEWDWDANEAHGWHSDHVRELWAQRSRCTGSISKHSFISTGAMPQSSQQVYMWCCLCITRGHPLFVHSVSSVFQLPMLVALQ